MFRVSVVLGDKRNEGIMTQEQIANKLAVDNFDGSGKYFSPFGEVFDIEQLSE